MEILKNLVALFRSDKKVKPVKPVKCRASVKAARKQSRMNRRKRK
jgi:hypothetical protein